MRKVKPDEMHGGYAGRSLQDKIRALMDKQNKRVKADGDRSSTDYMLKVGRLEGMAAALAILRNIPGAPSSVNHEIQLSNERINETA